MNMKNYTVIFLPIHPSLLGPLFPWGRFCGIELLLSKHLSHFTFPSAICRSPSPPVFTSVPVVAIRALVDVKRYHIARLICVFLTADINSSIFFISLLAILFAQSNHSICPFSYWDVLSFQATCWISSICLSRSILCLSQSAL